MKIIKTFLHRHRISKQIYSTSKFSLPARIVDRFVPVFLEFLYDHKFVVLLDAVYAQSLSMCSLFFDTY